MSGESGGINRVILVLSGKGGVGKSSVSVQLALALKARGHRVGLLDIDICGPSIPTMLGLSGRSVHRTDKGWVPVYTDESMTLGVMSIGFLLSNNDEAIVWRGPKKHAMIKQFITDVCWGQLDYLIVDTPPGTSDEHISSIEVLRSPDIGANRVEAVLVTTPQAVATADVRRQECSNLFASGGGQQLAEITDTVLLGSVPIDPKFGQSLEKGDNFLSAHGDSETAKAITSIIDSIVNFNN